MWRMVPTNSPGEWVELDGLTSLTVARSDRGDGTHVLFAHFDRRRQIIHRGSEVECITRSQELAEYVNRSDTVVIAQ